MHITIQLISKVVKTQTKIYKDRIKQQGMNFGEGHQQGHYIAYPIGISMIRLNYKRKLQKNL